MTKFKKFFSQMAVILAATTDYPTISQELPASMPVEPAMNTLELTVEMVSVQEQVKAVLAAEVQQHVASTLIAMNEKDNRDAKEDTRSE